MYEVKQHKPPTSRTLSLQNSQDVQRLKIAHSASQYKYGNTYPIIQREIPTDENQEPHPIPATGSYKAKANSTRFDPNIHKRSMFSFGSKTRDEVFSREEFYPQKVGNHVVAIAESSGQISNVEGIQLDHSTSWEDISNTMHAHNSLVSSGRQQTYYTVYEARMYYNDQTNLHPVLGALNASAGSMGVAIGKYQNPNIAPFIGELQTSWMNFQNYIASGIIETEGAAESEIIGRLSYIKNQLDSMVNMDIDGDDVSSD